MGDVGVQDDGSSVIIDSSEVCEAKRRSISGSRGNVAR